MGDGDFGGDGIGAAGPGPADFSESGDAAYGSGMGLGGGYGAGDFGGDFSGMDFSGMVGPVQSVPYGFMGPLSALQEHEDQGLFGKLKDALDSPWGKAVQFGLSVTNPALAPVFGITNMALAGTQGKGGQAMGNAFGNALSNFALGPVATQGLNMTGYGLGPNMGQAMAGIGTPGQSSFGIADGIGGLASLYGGYKQNQMYKQQANELSSMFSANSPYAQQLRQQLDRRDAAAGRRSQYGPREVELQAKLAQMASGVAPARLAATQQYGSSMNQNFQNLAHLYKMGAFNPLMDAASNGLGNMFIEESPYW